LKQNLVTECDNKFSKRSKTWQFSVLTVTALWQHWAANECVSGECREMAQQISVQNYADYIHSESISKHLDVDQEGCTNTQHNTSLAITDHIY